LVFESVARKPEEAVKLHEIHEMLGREYIVVYLEIADELVVERMLSRGRDEADTADNIKKRLQAFYDETQESINIFASHGKVRTVDANQEPEKVFEDIIKAISL
jgi:adenylate kinase family enzyme